MTNGGGEVEQRTEFHWHLPLRVTFVVPVLLLTTISAHSSLTTEKTGTRGTKPLLLLLLKEPERPLP